MFYISFKPFSYARLSDAPAVLLRATVMMCWLLTFGTAHADFAGGDGSESNPWEIATAEQGRVFRVGGRHRFV